MNATIFIDQLTNRQQERDDRLNAEYAKLVGDIAAGRATDTDRAERLLADLGKSASELKADVARHVRRDELKALVAKLPQLQRDLEVIDAKIAEADRVLREAEAAHESMVRLLADERRELVFTQNEALHAADELVSGCDDPELIRKRDELDAELGRVRGMIPRLCDSADHADAEARRYRERAATEIRLDGTDGLEARAAKHAADAERYRAEAKRLEREAAAIEKRQTELRERMMRA